MPNPTDEPRRAERLLALLLPLLFAAATIPFASVHPGPRLWVGLLAALVGAGAAWVALRARPLPWTGAALLFLALAALASCATSLLALDPARRVALQPGLAGPMGAVLELVGQPVHPLAPDPARALSGLAFALGVLLAGLGAAAVVRSLERARAAAWVLVLTGVAVVLIAALHWATDARAIWWISGVPVYARDPFFGPFVSCNHGGAACAALLPLALALMLRQDMVQRLVALGCSALLLLGVAYSGSRGAALEAGVAVVAFGLLLGSRTVLVLTALGLAAGLGALWKIGLRVVAVRLSSWVSPDAFEHDLLLGRGGIWSSTLDLFAGARWLGVGTGGFSDAYQAFKEMPEFTTTAHAHQDYLQALTEQGFLGGGAWIALAALPLVLGVVGCLTLHRGRRRSLLAGYSAAVAALLCSGFFEFGAHIGALALLLSLLCGVIVARAGHGLSALRGSVRATPWIAVGLGLSALALACGQIWAARDPESPWAPGGEAVQRGDEAWARALAAPTDPSATAEAEAWYRRALARRPLDAETLFKLARVQHLQGRDAEAVGTLQTATVVYPTLVWPWLHLARLRRQLDDPAAAREAYAHLLALDMPEDGSAAPYLREVLLTDDDPRVAFEAVLPPRADRMREAADVVFSLGDAGYAEELYVRALALDPQGTVAYASFLFRTRHYEEALLLLEGQDEGCFANRTAGNTLLALRRYDEALARFMAGQRDCGSDDVGIRAGIAQARLGMGDSAGLAVLADLVAAHPHAWAVRRALIQGLRQRGRREELLEHLGVLEAAGEATEVERAHLQALRRGLAGRPGAAEVP